MTQMGCLSMLLETKTQIRRLISSVLNVVTSGNSPISFELLKSVFGKRRSLFCNLLSKCTSNATVTSCTYPPKYFQKPVLVEVCKNICKCCSNYRIIALKVLRNNTPNANYIVFCPQSPKPLTGLFH